MNQVAAHFGKNLRRCRRRANLSQEALGVRASLHRTEVGLLERGVRVPRIDTLVKLSSGLGIEPDQLLEGMTWTPGDMGFTPGQFTLGETDGE